jgi:D-glycero-alpha-D-manno-heptose 1-phosphate guanylyltransferase
MISKTIPKTAIILAGGLGTRLKTLNPDRPKPMALVNNIPFLEYLLMYLVNLGIEIFILQVSYKYKIIQNHFGNEFRGSKLIYEIEDIPMGTGGGLIITENKYNESDILIINGDTFTEIEYEKFYKFHKSINSDLTLICRKDLNVETNLKFSLDNKSNLNFSKSENQLINCGVYLIRKKALNKFFKLKKSFMSFEDDILMQLINEKKVFGYLQKKIFIDIGTPLDYISAQTLIPKYFRDRHYL